MPRKSATHPKGGSESDEFRPLGYRGEVLKYTGTVTYHGSGPVATNNLQTFIYIQKGPSEKPLALRHSAVPVDEEHIHREGVPFVVCYAGDKAVSAREAFLKEPKGYKPPRGMARKWVEVSLEVVMDMQRMARVAGADERLDRYVGNLK